MEKDLNSTETGQENNKDNTEDKTAASIEMEKKKESRIKKTLHPLLNGFTKRQQTSLSQ